MEGLQSSNNGQTTTHKIPCSKQYNSYYRGKYTLIIEDVTLRWTAIQLCALHDLSKECGQLFFGIIVYTAMYLMLRLSIYKSQTSILGLPSVDNNKNVTLFLKDYLLMTNTESSIASLMVRLKLSRTNLSLTMYKPEENHYLVEEPLQFFFCCLLRRVK